MCCASSRLGTGRAVTRHGSHTQPRQGVPACRPFCSVQTVDSAAGRPQYRGEGPSPAVGNGMSQEPAEAPSEGQVMRAQWQRLGTGEGQRAFSVGQADQGTQASKATTDPQLLSSRLQEGYCSALARAPAQAEKTLGHRSTRHALVRQGAGAQRKGHRGGRWAAGSLDLGSCRRPSSKRGSVAAGRPMGCCCGQPGSCAGGWLSLGRGHGGTEQRYRAWRAKPETGARWGHQWRGLGQGQ